MLFSLIQKCSLYWKFSNT